MSQRIADGTIFFLYPLYPSVIIGWDDSISHACLRCRPGDASHSIKRRKGAIVYSKVSESMTPSILLTPVANSIATFRYFNISCLKDYDVVSPLKHQSRIPELLLCLLRDLLNFLSTERKCTTL